MNIFLDDVLKGLQSSSKYLDSKYFYDKKGDGLFQKIMASDEYYLTNAEMSILSEQRVEMATAVLQNTEKIDVIEFGPGDAVKSIHLLKELSKRNAVANYFPIDISKNIITLLNKKIPTQIPQLSIHGFSGEYLEMLSEVNKVSVHKKLVLFLGANIGNFKFNEIAPFCKKLRSQLSVGDMVLIGFDLKKKPQTILAAYNDKAGFTKEFNLNLLSRINTELNANFNLNNFEHYATYDPQSGASKSFLISMENQEVSIEGNSIYFEKYEPIFMEISQKYTQKQINEIAQDGGFKVSAFFFDKKEYFTDVLLRANDE